MSLLGCHCFNETSGWIEKEKMYHHVGEIKEQGISCTSPIFQERQVSTHFSKWEMERGVSGIPLELIFSVRVPAYSSQPELLMKWATPLRSVLSLRALAWKKKRFKSSGREEQGGLWSLSHEEDGSTQEKLVSIQIWDVIGALAVCWSAMLHLQRTVLL